MPSLRLSGLLAAGLLATTTAQAITLVGLNSQNQLVRIDTNNIGAAMAVDINGLAAGDRFVGIDTRPKDGLLYGITLSNKIYTINEMTGAISFVAALSAPVVSANQGYGLDFNPVADAGVGPSLRVVSASGDNFAVNASTGAVGNSANKIAAGYTAVAYTNSMPNQGGAPVSTALYYISSGSDMLAMAPGAFNTPTISNVGPLGIDVLQANGFEITGNGMAYAALNVDGASLDTGIYGINLATGQATLLGNYNGTLSGLTVSAVPEPQSLALMLAGLMGVGALARRKQRAR